LQSVCLSFEVSPNQMPAFYLEMEFGVASGHELDSIGQTTMQSALLSKPQPIGHLSAPLVFVLAGAHVHASYSQYWRSVFPLLPPVHVARAILQ
jgi:hypothetical protein